MPIIYWIDGKKVLILLTSVHIGLIYWR